MRTVMIPALVAACTILSLSAGWAQDRDQQRKEQARTGVQTLNSTVNSTNGVTDPAKMASDKPAPGAKLPGAAPVDRTYIIGPEDTLRVLVWGQGGIPGEYMVRPDGMISVPLAGEVRADGRTAEELEKEVAQRLKDSKLILDPRVTVQILGVHSKKIFISGEVNHPGSMDLVVPTRISEALAAAGGFRDFAKITKIRIVHRDGTTSRYNDKEVSHGKHMEQDILLKPGDHIYVD